MVRSRGTFGQRGTRCGRARIDPRYVAVPFLFVASTCTAAESVRPKAEAPKASVACPSQDFSKFLQVFSDSAGVQRRFTRLPLEYGQVDVGSVGTAQEYTRRMIGTFEKIPTFDRQNGGTIFPTKSKRTREHLLTKEVTGVREDPEYPEESRSPEDGVVMLFIEDTGFHIYFRFARLEGCWFLHAIHDKSA
jgi:hypothetical protein